MIRTFIITSFIALFGIFTYGQTAHSFAAPGCPCDLEAVGEDPTLTGNEILDMICPGGELAPDGVSEVSNENVLVATEEPPKRYRVGMFRGNLVCEISVDGMGSGIRLTDNQFNSCRQRVINACSLNQRPIPTMSEWGLIAMAGLIGIVGFIAVRRRAATM